ncbi:MAG: hypothetical protein NTY02_20410, partial [Acidobacteria bacterium]|nr:hypothetical protein [Acidobacteriota bacterium]
MAESSTSTDDRARVLLHALAVGLLSGTVAIAVRYAADALPRLIWPHAPDLVSAVAAAPTAWKLAIPTLGALLAGAVLTLGTRWSGATQGW